MTIKVDASIPGQATSIPGQASEIDHAEYSRQRPCDTSISLFESILMGQFIDDK
jgi:hypothetical protein